MNVPPVPPNPTKARDEGQAFVDDAPETTLTYRETAEAITETITPFQGDGLITLLTGPRMAVGFPGPPSPLPPSAMT